MADVKLPGITYGGRVQGLGRYDASGPLRAANAAAAAATAQARAAGTVADTLEDVGDLTMRLYEANAAAEYDKALAEFSKHELRLRKMLEAGPVIDTQQWDLPDWVSIPGGREETISDEQGETTSVPRRFIPTYQIAEQVYSGSMDRVSQAVLSEVSNPKALAALKKKLPTVTDKGGTSVAAKQHEYYVAHQKGLVAAAIEDSIQIGDEKAARNAALRAFHTGLYDREAFESTMADISHRIDEAFWTDAFLRAETSDELDEALVGIRDSRIKPGTQRSMASAIEARKAKLDTHQDKIRSERSTEMLGYALDMLFADHLDPETQRMMQQRLEPDDRIRLSQAASSWRDTSRRRGLESDADFLREAQSKVASIPYPPPGSTVNSELQAVKRKVRDWLSKGYLGPEDASGLLAEANRLSQMPYSTEQYSEARRQIWNDSVQMSEQEWRQFKIEAYRQGGSMQAMMESKSILAEQATAAVRDLQSYINTFGGDATPLQWWVDNQSRYLVDPLKSENHLELFTRRYPSYEADSIQEVLTLISKDTSIPPEVRAQRFAEARNVQRLMDAATTQAQERIEADAARAARRAEIEEGR